MVVTKVTEIINVEIELQVSRCHQIALLIYWGHKRKS